MRLDCAMSNRRISPHTPVGTIAITPSCIKTNKETFSVDTLLALHDTLNCTPDNILEIVNLDDKTP